MSGYLSRLELFLCQFSAWLGFFKMEFGVWNSVLLLPVSELPLRLYNFHIGTSFVS